MKIHGTCDIWNLILDLLLNTWAWMRRFLDKHTTIVMYSVLAILVVTIFCVLWNKWGWNSKNKKIFKAFLMSVIVPTICFWTLLAQMNQKTPFSLEVLSPTVLFATLMAILVYTWKTWQLKDLTFEQLSYNSRPVITLQLKKNEAFFPLMTGRDGVKLIKGVPYAEIGTVAILKNIGEGIASHIKIRPIVVHGESPDGIRNCEIIALGKMDEETVKLYAPTELIVGDQCVGRWLLDGTCSDRVIRIDYKSLDGKSFFTLMKCNEIGGGWHFYKTGEETKEIN